MFATTFFIHSKGFVDAANPYFLLLSSAVILWLFVWGGIKMWHKWQSSVLEDKLGPLLETKVIPIIAATMAPMFTKLETEQERQATIIGEIHHEVNLNSGSSIKDAVVAMRDSQRIVTMTLGRLEDQVQKIDRGLERHLGMHEGMAKVERN